MQLGSRYFKNCDTALAVQGVKVNVCGCSIKNLYLIELGLLLFVSNWNPCRWKSFNPILVLILSRGMPEKRPTLLAVIHRVTTHRFLPSGGEGALVQVHSWRYQAVPLPLM